MSVAIRSIVRVQDADDAPSLDAGQDGYALTWDNATSAFVATALTGSGLAADGSVTGATSQAQAFTNGVSIGATALELTFAGTNVLNAPIGSILFNNNGTTAASIVAHEMNYGGYNDADLVFYTALNGSLTEKLRLPRSGTLTLPSTGLGFVAATNTYVTGDGYNVLYLGARRQYLFTSPVLGNIASIGGDENFATYLRKVTPYTNSPVTMLTLNHETSGTAAAGFGAGLLFALESSTTAAQNAARIQALWNDATHATRKADLVLTAYDTAEREGLRIRGAGSAPAIGFYGVSPIERATLATGAGASVDDVITALQNLGLVKQS